MKKFLFVLLGCALANLASAKLPALSDEAKAKADETKAKAAWGDKVAAYKLCLSQDKVAAQYMKAKGAEAKPATATPPCQDPGPYAAPVAAASAPAATGAASGIPTPPKK
jgi:hypothetical protein